MSLKWFSGNWSFATEELASRLLERQGHAEAFLLGDQSLNPCWGSPDLWDFSLSSQSRCWVSCRWGTVIDTPTSVLVLESALGSRPRVALSSAQACTGATTASGLPLRFPPFPGLLQLAVPLGPDLLLAPQDPVHRRHVADPGMQAHLVVMARGGLSPTHSGSISGRTIEGASPVCRSDAGKAEETFC